MRINSLHDLSKEYIKSNSSLDSNNSLSNDDSFNTDSIDHGTSLHVAYYKVKIVNNLSKNIPSEYFTNMLPSLDNHDFNYAIRSIKKHNNKYCIIDELHLSIDDDLLEHNTNVRNEVRYINIFKEFGIQYGGIIYKSRYLENTKCSLRIYSRIIGNTLQILLFDPHHLFATDIYKILYKNCVDYHFDIADL